jgi:hypothetical protein
MHCRFTHVTSQYLNARNKHALKGIGLGGSEGRPRLFLNEDMDACRASDFGMTFEMGPLRSNVATAMPASLEQGECTSECMSECMSECEWRGDARRGGVAAAAVVADVLLVVMMMLVLWYVVATGVARYVGVHARLSSVLACMLVLLLID